MAEKSRGKVGYSMECKIFDRHGAKVFEWRPGQGNLILGFLVLTEYVEKKIGIDIRKDYLDLLSDHPRVKRCFGFPVSTQEEKDIACEH